MLIDSHCHLDRLDLTAHDGSLDAALDAARQRGVGKFLCIGVDAANAPAVKQIAEQYSDVYCSVGIHPLDLTRETPTDLDWLLHALDHPRVVAIGETGLDYHYEPEMAAQQQISFNCHLQAARQTGKPVIIHTREARADTLNLLREADLPNAGVLHCFTEDWDMARAALDMGYYISLVETASPYLAPVPHRGKPNEPQFVCDVAAFLAELRGEPLEQLWQNTTDNFHRLFPLSV